MAFGVISLAVAFSTIAIPFSFAADSTSTDNPVATITNVPPAPSQEGASASITQTNKLNKLITAGEKEIDKRVLSLNNLKSAIQASKLSSDQQSALTSLIDTNVSGLSSLEGQIKAGTDAAAVKILDQQIFSNFRIYAVFIPQINEVRSLDTERNSADHFLNVTLPKIQTSIDAAKSKGQDVTARQSALDNAKAQIPIIESNIDAQVTTVLSFKPADYPATSKTELSAARDQIRSIRNQLRTLWNSVKTAQ